MQSKPYFKVSKGNSKLGNITNINLPAGITCACNAPCKKECYALKGTYNFRCVKKRYQENLKAYQDDHNQAFIDIAGQLPKESNKQIYVRYHSSGDIVDYYYFIKMIELANIRRDIKFLAFTKKYDIINEYLKVGGTIPYNLKIVFSTWIGYDCQNFDNLPVAQIAEFYDKSNSPYAEYKCFGSCSECKRCWHLEKGEGVLFHQH